MKRGHLLCSNTETKTRPHPCWNLNSSAVYPHVTSLIAKPRFSHNDRPPASILPLWALSRGSVLITTSHTSLPGVLFIFRSPSTVAARLSLCVTFFSAQKKDDRKSFLSPSWIPLIARPPQHSLVAIPKGCVAHHAASTAYQARECSQGTS